jgi:serine protease
VTKLSVWYSSTCPDTVQYDWATATLRDNGTGAVATIIAKTCPSSSAWSNATGSITAGHSYTLTLTSHDDDYAGDATYTRFDDIALS